MPVDALIEQRRAAVETAVARLSSRLATGGGGGGGHLGCAVHGLVQGGPGLGRGRRIRPRPPVGGPPARGRRVRYLLDTDHLSILQQQSGPEYLALAARLALPPPTDLGLSVV